MAVDYRYERGWVGDWKSYQVYILEKSEYMNNQYNLNDNTVYVIADDGMRMVNKGYIIGYLSRNGTVNECDIAQFRKQRRGLLLEKKLNIPEGYFDSFAGEVIEFFKHLNIVE